MNRKTTIIAIAIVAAVLLLSLVIIVFYNFHSATLASCSPNGALLTQISRQNNDLLRGFPVSCIRVLDQKGSGVIAGFVYVASSQEQLQQGFMNVTTFGNCNGFANETNPCVGMIFVFSSTQQECFWMRDTILPLLQSWIAANGTVTAIYSASPETDTTVCHPGQYVLESNASTLISVGDRALFNET